MNKSPSKVHDRDTSIMSRSNKSYQLQNKIMVDVTGVDVHNRDEEIGSSNKVSPD
jgi:hypothetical protein